MPAPTRPEPGTRLIFRWRKWDGGDHWMHECVYLGADEWGEWFGQMPGWRSWRPGRDVVLAGPNVTLLPPSGDYALTFNAPPAKYRIYIDIAWDVRWDAAEPTGIDMDLDVIRLADDGTVFIDDRDEWDEHRVQYGYPEAIVAELEEVALDLERRVSASVAPFDDATGDAWLARLAALGLDGRAFDAPA